MRRFLRWSRFPDVSKTRRWVEEAPPPPVDLRLVPAAAAVWCGVLLGSLSGEIAWWAIILAVATGVVAATGVVIVAASIRWQSTRWLGHDTN